MNLKFLVTPEYSCSQPPEYRGKGMYWPRITLGNVVGNCAGLRMRTGDRRSRDGSETSGGTSLSEMSLQMIMLTKTFYLVTSVLPLWSAFAEKVRILNFCPKLVRKRSAFIQQSLLFYFSPSNCLILN